MQPRDRSRFIVKLPPQTPRGRRGWADVRGELSEDAPRHVRLRMPFGQPVGLVFTGAGQPRGGVNCPAPPRSSPPPSLFVTEIPHSAPPSLAGLTLPQLYVPQRPLQRGVMTFTPTVTRECRARCPDYLRQDICAGLSPSLPKGTHAVTGTTPGSERNSTWGGKAARPVLGLERPRGAQQPLSPLPSFGGTREREVSFLFEPLCFGAYVAQQLSLSLTHTLDSRTS